MHFKGEQTVCSQVLLTSHPEELWVFQEEEERGESSGKEEKEDTSLAFGTFLWVVQKRKQASLP